MSDHSNAASTVAIAGADPRLYNHDLAPVAPAGRTWGVFSIFAMWMSDVHSVGGYTFAASLFFLGLTGWEVLLAMMVGITAVYFLMNLIGRPSLKYGTPFPGGGADVVRRHGRQYRGRLARHRRHRLVRRADLFCFQSRAGAGAGVFSRRRSVDAWQLSRPVGAGLVLVSCSCGCFSC